MFGIYLQQFLEYQKFPVDLEYLVCPVHLGLQ